MRMGAANALDGVAEDRRDAQLVCVRAVEILALCDLAEKTEKVKANG